MRASRLLSILILLQLRGRQTAQALAQQFEVSVRTIYRDVDALSAAGVPVQSDRGPSGGFQLLGNYRTQLTGLATDEIEAMFMIGLPGPAAALGLGTAAARASGKLLAALPQSFSKDASRISTRFHLDPVDWYRAAEPVPHLPAIARAVLDAHPIAMRYESWSGTHDWLVEPLGLVQKAGAWYLVARGAKKIRIFKVANILAHTVQPTTFTPPADFDLSATWLAELTRFESTLRPGKAVLHVSALGRKRIAALGEYAAQAAAHAAAQARPPNAAGWAQMQLPIENIEQAALLLLGVGPEVEVLEPAELRQRLAQLARLVAKANTAKTRQVTVRV